MIDVASDVLPTMGLLGLSIVLTAISLWMAGRLAGWFLQEAIAAPSLKSFLFSFNSDADFDRVRIAVFGLGFAVMLTILLAIAVGARIMGWSPNF